MRYCFREYIFSYQKSECAMESTQESIVMKYGLSCNNDGMDRLLQSTEIIIKIYPIPGTSDKLTAKQKLKLGKTLFNFVLQNKMEIREHFLNTD